MAKVEMISEILTKVEKETSRKKKVEILKSYSKNNALRVILKGTFDKNVEFLLPEGDPPFTTQDAAIDNRGALYNEVRKMYLYVKNDNSDNINPIKRERLFIEMLETLPKEEAAVVLGMKDGKLPFKGITEKLVREAFPELISS